MTFDSSQSSYMSLRDIIAERTNSIAAWIGSGMSRTAGIPLWSELKGKLSNELTAKIQRLDEVDEKQRLGAISVLASSEKNFWLSFSMLREALGTTTYQSTIRESMAIADTCLIPSNYRLLWELPLSGIFNLNIDRLATRSHSEKFAGRSLNEFTGKEAGDFTGVLKGSIPFILNLHGIVANERSWVFTHEEFKSLYYYPGYHAFIDTCLISKTLIFIGISAEDIAVGGHLENLREKNIDFGTHYWITDRSDFETEKWAESVGVRIIRYDATDGNHKELEEIIQGLLKYVPKEIEAPPVTLSSSDCVIPALQSPDKMTALPPDEVRKVLNAHVYKMLESRDEAAYKQYGNFIHEYEIAVHHAWYLTVSEPHNCLFGYRLIKEIAEGAFGRVFQAIAPSGEKVAIKVLKEDVMRNKEMLQSFRRGIRSMDILSKRKARGMVPHRETTEIPALAVMDFVEGPDLRQAVLSNYINDWKTILSIAVDLAGIIRNAHSLPERVLHRDIRPSNIMLKGYYTEASWEVVVLDFDLSWHLGAMEKSIISTSTASSYLAPEQVDRIPDVSTRNAAVDSFGLGMTLFFLRTGKDPQFQQHRHANWQQVLLELICSKKCSNWHSLPLRFARLVENSTHHHQPKRLDMSQIEGELQRLKEAEENPFTVDSAELIAEEIAARATLLFMGEQKYMWNRDRLRAQITLMSGVYVELIAQESQHLITASFVWSNTGSAEFKNVRKYLGAACSKAISILEKGGWKMEMTPDYSFDRVAFSVSTKVQNIKANLDTVPKALATALAELKFD